MIDPGVLGSVSRLRHFRVLAAAAVFGVSLPGLIAGPGTGRAPRGPAAAARFDRVGYATLETFEGGAIYRTSQGGGGRGSFDVLVLEGDWRQMGRQYGHLLRNRFVEMQAAVEKQLQATEGAVAKLPEGGRALYDQHLDYAKTFVQGMAETSGLGFERQLVANVLLYGAIALGGCSSLDVWGDYTGGRPLVVGRNWDVGANLNPLNRFLTVVVYKPAGATHWVADINYVGTFLFQTGMNSRGLFLDLQNGALSDSTVRRDRPSSNDSLFAFLTEAASTDELDAKFEATPAQGGLVMNAADPTRGRVYEWASFGTRIRNGAGAMASSNHFVDATWDRSLPDILAGATHMFSKERLANLVASAEESKGRFDAARMMALFDKTIDKGGPTFPARATVHQVVAVPAERLIWLKATDYSEWEKIPLGPLFR